MTLSDLCSPFRFFSVYYLKYSIYHINNTIAIKIYIESMTSNVC